MDKASAIGNLAQRIDIRTPQEFEEDIRLATRAEQVWAKVILKNELGERGHRITRIIDTGMENSGKLILDSRGVHSGADFFFDIEGKPVLAEIKTHYKAPDDYRDLFIMTFKECSIRGCLDVPRQVRNILASYRITNYGRTAIFVVHRAWWIVLKQETLAYLLDNFEAKIYPKFSPNDPAIRLYREDIQKMFREKRMVAGRWKESSEALIRRCSDDLFTVHELPHT